ncbi:two-component system, NtrC family, nitrogen regulation response regulator GlnG [Catalinimonas alkaloidigena]|uniref:Two-component system, NtrC family, nitrogen regulation response regulator GlnG n=1 Tax=Catalinimonas alkaloidigena TaxID=1075417 RepID=A0A1G9BRL0_9BACT|nr:response regulator [Catalinimonas alkaloidigena]SDK42086.1 two-component system, NtrC family, nitrogen regulation response regulator GlnG [Catalinimonas alkaloidigena]
MKSKYKVYIIEDNRTEAMVIRLAFSGIDNIEVYYFESGQQLLDCLLESRPDIVIIDLMLPDIDGLTLLRRIRAYDQSIYTVVMSAQEDINVINAVQREGVFNYVVKSDSCLRYLKQVIENLLLLLESKQKATTDKA